MFAITLLFKKGGGATFTTTGASRTELNRTAVFTSSGYELVHPQQEERIEHSGTEQLFTNGGGGGVTYALKLRRLSAYFLPSSTHVGL